MTDDDFARVSLSDQWTRSRLGLLMGGRGALALVLVLALGAVGCGGPSVTLDQDRSAFEEEERRLEKRLSNNPEDGAALRELGSIYMRTDRPSQAYDALKKAYSRRPDDPKVLFYLGLASEKVGRQEAALDLFQKFDEVPEDSKYRTLMEGRYEWLARKQAERQVEQMVADERERPADVRNQVDRNTVAVVPLAYQGGDEQYQPLGRGLAEMFTTDLANVGRLKVVERVRLQAILDELELARSEYVEQSTAPRVGQLLGAGRVVGGSYLVTDESELRLQVTLADVASGEQIPQLDRERASLDEIFDLQKEVTFSIVDQLGVELTPQERAAIEEVPTRNTQAFLAYSRGLAEEDRGNYGAAAQFYQEAQQIDPNFEQASQREQKAKRVETAGGSEAQALASAEEGDVGGDTEDGDATQGDAGGEIDLVQQRQESMGASTGPNSTESERDPAQEENTAEEEGDSDLEDPPDPPSSGGGGDGGS